MKALQAIGFKKSFVYFYRTFVYLIFRGLIFPPLRTLFLRLCGAKIGKNCVIHSIKFFNYYRGGFCQLSMGSDCFLGNDVLLDLASPIRLGNQVTLSERVAIVTHLNVGYADHPLQKDFPSQAVGVTIGDGCFVGINATILDGVNLGPKTFVGAGSLVNESNSGSCLLVGVPAKSVKTL